MKDSKDPDTASEQPEAIKNLVEGINEGKKEIEQSSLKVNIEACHEIARQIRLRNISGIIMIDFINLKEEENKKILIDTLKECVKDDKMQVNVLGLTKLGLCEMTRQKKRKMLKDILK